jgi:cell division protein FtsB
MAMLSVLAVLIYLYVSGGIRLLSTWKEARSDRGAVATLAREHAALVHQHEALGREGTVEGEARRLGMMKKGEQPYIVTGLPHD